MGSYHKLNGILLHEEPDLPMRIKPSKVWSATSQCNATRQATGTSINNAAQFMKVMTQDWRKREPIKIISPLPGAHRMACTATAAFKSLSQALAHVIKLIDYTPIRGAAPAFVSSLKSNSESRRRNQDLFRAKVLRDKQIVTKYWIPYWKLAEHHPGESDVACHCADMFLSAWDRWH